MTVYVDDALHSFGRMKMCHMLADTPNELFEMADKIGVARKWFQQKASAPHFDICKSRRELALKFGAISVDRRGMYEVLLRIRRGETAWKLIPLHGWQ